MSVYAQALAPLGAGFNDGLGVIRDAIGSLSPAQGLVICLGVIAFAVYVAARPPRLYAGGPPFWSPAFGLSVLLAGTLVFGLILGFAVYAPGVALAAEVAEAVW